MLRWGDQSVGEGVRREGVLRWAPSGESRDASLVAARLDAVGERARRSEVARENHVAAMLSPFDARMIFAEQVARRLEGGGAAILRPQVREGLVAQAHRLGMRTFDANLVIAIVQDAARRGEVRVGETRGASAGSSGLDASERVRASLGMVRPARGMGAQSDGVLGQATLAVVIALVLLLGLVVLLMP